MKKRNRVRARLPTRHLRLGDVRDGSRVTHHWSALWRCGRFVLWCSEVVQSRIEEKKQRGNAERIVRRLRVCAAV